MRNKRYITLSINRGNMYLLKTKTKNLKKEGIQRMTIVNVNAQDT